MKRDLVLVLKYGGGEHDFCLVGGLFFCGFF